MFMPDGRLEMSLIGMPSPLLMQVFLDGAVQVLIPSVFDRESLDVLLGPEARDSFFFLSVFLLFFLFFSLLSLSLSFLVLSKIYPPPPPCGAETQDPKIH